MKELPDKMSALLRVAVADMEACRADPRYVLNMSTFHSPSLTQEDCCHVCLAGAVIAKTLEFPISEKILSLSILGTETANKMRALDAIRTRSVDFAIGYLVGHNVDVPELADFKFEWPDWYRSTSPDSGVLLELADALEAVGL